MPNEWCEVHLPSRPPPLGSLAWVRWAPPAPPLLALLLGLRWYLVSDGCAWIFVFQLHSRAHGGYMEVAHGQHATTVPFRGGWLVVGARTAFVIPSASNKINGDNVKIDVFLKYLGKQDRVCFE